MCVIIIYVMQMETLISSKSKFKQAFQVFNTDIFYEIYEIQCSF